jgi:hypothetical protein
MNAARLLRSQLLGWLPGTYGDLRYRVLDIQVVGFGWWMIAGEFLDRLGESGRYDFMAPQDVTLRHCQLHVAYIAKVSYSLRSGC